MIDNEREVLFSRKDNKANYELSIEWTITAIREIGLAKGVC